MLAIIEIFVEILFEIFAPLIFEVLFEVIVCGFFSLLGELISTLVEKTGDAIEATSEALGDATEAVASSVKIGFLIVFILLVTGIGGGLCNFLGLSRPYLQAHSHHWDQPAHHTFGDGIGHELGGQMESESRPPPFFHGNLPWRGVVRPCRCRHTVDFHYPVLGVFSLDIEP